MTPDRLTPGRISRIPLTDTATSTPTDLACVLGCFAAVADTLDMLALAFRDGISEPRTTLSYYAQGRADGLAWAAEQLRTTLTDLAQH